MEEDIQRWLDQAIEDLETARFNFKGDRYRAAAFFSQQAAEKALKALYIKRFKKLKKIHDLFILATELNLPKELVDLCKELSPAYTYTRYPDVIEIKDIEEVSEDLINHAEKIIKWIQERI